MNAIYARQSADKVDSVSIESQIEHCKYETKKEEFMIFTDKGFSGKNTERPEFKLMMNRIKEGLIKKVIVYKLDRISRSILDFSNMMQFFQEHGVEFVSTTEKFDTSAPMGRAMLNICIVFAQLERETIQKRITDAYVSRSKMGLYMGGKVPYGFSTVPANINGVNTAQYSPIKEEIEHIKIIFEKYEQPATSVSEVAKYFRDNNIKKTRGVGWDRLRITEILRNPIYVKADMDLYNFFISRNTEIVGSPEHFTGENACYPYVKPAKSSSDSKRKLSQYDNMILVLAPHKGIIDSETWIKCRLKLEKNAQVPTAKRTKRSWLSGKLKCGKCGYALKYSGWVGKTTELEYFICSGRSDHKCTGFGAIRKEIVEGKILKQIKEKIKEVNIEQNNPDPHHIESNSIKYTIANKEKEIKEILEKLQNANETVLKYINIKIEELDNEILELKNELLKCEINKTGKKQLNLEEIKEIFDSWDIILLEDKQAFIDILIKKVAVTKELIEITWNI